MNIFLKKLKKCPKKYSLTYIITSMIYLISLVLFIYSLSKLSGIETIIRIIAIIFFIIWFFIYLLTSPLSLFTKKNKTFIAITIISLLFVPIFIGSSYVINTFYAELTNFTKSHLTYTTNLVTLKDYEFTSSSKIGMISDNNDIEGNILAKKLIEKESLTNEIVNYDDYYLMLADLYNQKIDAIFLSGNYVVLFSSEKTYENIAEETNVIYEYSEEMENQDYKIKSDKKLTEPFTVLLMGVDSEKDGLNANQAFNGDTLMMVTFNPNTLTATMFSMPRDMYVPIACRNGALAKVNSSAAYGTSCVIDTLEDITNVPIDYYVKMNFKGVVDLVDAVGGITVNIEEPYFRYNHGIDCGGKFCEQNSNREYGSETIYLDPGIQKINGEEALAYARCRALYIESDLARNRHQQEIVEATAKEFKNIRSIDDFKKILDAISKNMDTNITTDQMLSFYEVAKDIIFKDSDSDELISIKKTYLQSYNLPVYLPGSNTTTSALGYYKASLDAITKAMRVNLELEEAEMPKSFSISYNEEYTSNIIGKGLTDNSKIETMPNFVGKTITEATNWGANNNIVVSFEYVDSNSAYYNPNIQPGLISNQSVHSNTILTNVSSVIFYINNASTNNENSSLNEEDLTDEETDNNEEIPEIEIPGGPTL